jgi:transcriptional regulator with XRE-family HTH domain
MINSTEARISHRLLKWAREKSALTLEEASEKMGVALECLAKWEKGDAFPNFEQLDKISELYRMPVRMFYLCELKEKIF